MAYGAMTIEVSQLGSAAGGHGPGDPEASEWKIVFDRRESDGSKKTFQVNGFVVVPYSTVLWIKEWLAHTSGEEYFYTSHGSFDYINGFGDGPDYALFFERNELRVSVDGLSNVVTRANVAVH